MVCTSPTSLSWWDTELSEVVESRSSEENLDNRFVVVVVVVLEAPSKSTEEVFREKVAFSPPLVRWWSFGGGLGSRSNVAFSSLFRLTSKVLLTRPPDDLR